MIWDQTVDILGTEYIIESIRKNQDKYMEENRLIGYCNDSSRTIKILELLSCDDYKDMDERACHDAEAVTLRHELIHAFLSESGLRESSMDSNGPWSKNEEMVDWFAIMAPKIFKVYEKTGCLNYEEKHKD